MPALAPYIPAKDAALSSWLDNFSSLITAAPGTYGLASGDATTIAASVAVWDAAYALVTSPTTKTAASVSAKNIAKVNALAVCRPYAQLVANNAGVSADNKIALGLNPKTSTPVPITAPTTTPLLTVNSQAALQMFLRYRDSLASPSVKSKPYGVVQVQLFGATSATAITDPTLLPLKVSTTKSPFTVTWLSGDLGKTAYIAARYITRKGLLGPWSPIVSAVVS